MVFILLHDPLISSPVSWKLCYCHQELHSLSFLSCNKAVQAFISVLPTIRQRFLVLYGHLPPSHYILYAQLIFYNGVILIIHNSGFQLFFHIARVQYMLCYSQALHRLMVLWWFLYSCTYSLSQYNQSYHKTCVYHTFFARVSIIQLLYHWEKSHLEAHFEPKVLLLYTERKVFLNSQA